MGGPRHPIREGEPKAVRIQRLRREWHIAHPERMREIKRKSASRPGAPSRAASKKVWRKANPEKGRQEYMRMKAKNPDRMRLQTARWRELNPERSKEVSANHCHRRRSWTKSGSVSASDWTAIKEAFDRRCAYCLRQLTRLEQDHVTALSRGGEHTPDNVVPACRSCNARKGNRGILSMLKAA